MNRDNITASQLTTLLLASSAAPAMLNIIVVFTQTVGRMSLAAIGLNAVVTTVLLFLVLSLQRRVGFRDPVDVLKSSFGQFFGHLIALGVTLIFLYGASIILRIVIFIISRLFLPLTSNLILSLLFYLPVIMIALCGLRLFGNLSIFLYILLPVFVSLFILPVENYTFTFLFPLWEGNLSDLLKGWYSYFFTLMSTLALFYLLPYVGKRVHLARSLWCFLLLVFSLCLFVFVAGVAFFGFDVISDLLMPFYNLSSARKGTMLERTDVLFILILVPTIGLMLSFYYTTFYLSQRRLFLQVNQQHPRRVMMMTGLLIVLLSLGNIYGGNIWLTVSYLNYFYAFLLLLLIAAYVIEIAKKRRYEDA